jgi:polygalacturonase
MGTMIAFGLTLMGSPAAATIWNGVAEVRSAGVDNTRTLNAALAQLRPGDTLRIPNETFWVAGGVRASGLSNVTLVLDGTLKFLPGRHDWPAVNCADDDNPLNHNPLQPKRSGSCVREAIFIANSTRLTLTSTGRGTLYGSGESWWGYIQYLIHGENRPRLFALFNATDVLVEHWSFLQSPYWTFTALDVARMEIRHCTIDNRINHHDSHDVSNLDAFNTDGFDVAGRDIHIHDATVWNQDDCFTIQPLDGTAHNSKCTENVLVENVRASGLGLTIGAVHPTRNHNCVRNVTFRNATMHHTFKGIYVKSGSSFDPAATAEISNILYENISMDGPTQVPIWIGPAQEADSKGACSLLWPGVPLQRCPPPPETLAWANITLRNIHISDPKESPGVVFGNPNRPIANVLFENVTVAPADEGKRPWRGRFYYCQGVQGVSALGTSPAPPCFREAASVSSAELRGAAATILV